MVRYRHLRQSPILLTSLLLSLFWVLVLVDPAGTREDLALTSFFAPAPSAVVFGFLGAYVFALFALLRSYLRKDLRPKTYAMIAARIMLVAALAWVFEQLLSPSTGLNVAMFMIGIVPQSALQYLDEVVMGRILRRWKSDLRDRAPLSTVDGIDIYERLRLEEEGVTNLEALAHHDLIDLMLETRIPAPRLVDWVDQAVLQLYVPPQASGQDREAALDEELRGIGVRTATDLLQLCDGEHTDEHVIDELRQISRVHNDGTSRAEIVAMSMADDHWIGPLLNWRQNRPGEPHKVDCRAGPAASPPDTESGGAPAPGPATEEAAPETEPAESEGVTVTAVDVEAAEVVAAEVEADAERIGVE